MRKLNGKKDDDDKLRYDLIPLEALEAIAEVFTRGGKKYGDHNWREGFRWGRLWAAALRHLVAFWRGEDFDPEWGCHHLAHAACCVMMLLSHVLTKSGHDDRSSGALQAENEAMLRDLLSGEVLSEREVRDRERGRDEPGESGVPGQDAGH